MKKMLLSLFVALFMTACAGGSTPTQAEISQEDTMNTAIAAVMQTQAAQATAQPTATVALPTVIPTDTPVDASGKEFSWNYAASQDSGGVTITIGRVVFAQKDALPKDLLDGLNTSVTLVDKPVVGEIIFIVENKNNFIVTVYPNFGKVLVGSEQIDLMDFWSDGTSVSGGDYGGDVLPGAKLIGGLWFGLSRTNLADINSMTIYIEAAHDQNFQNLGQDFNFILDLSQKQFVPYPEELK